jgi:hypothetical protein
LAARRNVMTAQEIIADLERRRHELMLRGMGFDEERQELAYRILAENSFTARQRWREVEDETQQLLEDIAMHDLAIASARRRAEAVGRNVAEVMAEIFGAKT